MKLPSKYDISINVVVPFHRVDDFLFDAIESVKKSKHVRTKIVAVNDTRTRITKSTLPLRTEDQLIDNDSHGYLGALASGIAHCDENFVSFLDSDDLSHPLRLIKQVIALETTAADYCSSRIIRINQNNRILRNSGILGEMPDNVDRRAILLLGAHGSDSTVVMRTEVARDYWKTHRTFPSIYSDYGFALSLPDDIQFIHEPTAIYYYRTHPKQMSRYGQGSDDWEKIFPLWKSQYEKLCLSQGLTPVNHLTPNTALAIAFPAAYPKLQHIEKLQLNEILASFSMIMKPLDLKSEKLLKKVLDIRRALFLNNKLYRKFTTLLKMSIKLLRNLFVGFAPRPYRRTNSHER